MTNVISEPCVDVCDRACLTECPVDCIYEGERMRQDWLGLPSQVIPAVVGHDQILRSGTEALRYLAHLAGAGNALPRLPARAEDDPGTRPQRLATARAA